MKTTLNYQLKEELNSQIIKQGFWKEMPEREMLAANFIAELFKYLFPTSDSCMEEELYLDQKYIEVYKLLRQLYQPVLNNGCEPCYELENEFFKNLPVVYNLLLEDAHSIFSGDPAAQSINEVIHIYPGFYAIFVHRVANVLYRLKSPLIARMLSEYAHSKTGIDIHPGATIGRAFGIDHGTGIVIGETTIIGDNVRIYQGVTLGAKTVEKELSMTKRHPTIENNVVIYAGATILGGRTVIGHNSIVGGNVFLTHSVEPNSMVYFKPEVAIKSLCNESCLIANID